MNTPEQILPKYRVQNESVPDWIVNEANIINEALDREIISKTEAQSGLTTETEIKDTMLDVLRQSLEIKYFVEYPSENVEPEKRGKALQELFQQQVTKEDGSISTLADLLHEQGSTVSIAMSTLDADTADAVRILNQKGVPVVAWVVVDDVEGYWSNPANIALTAKKTQEIIDWSAENKLDITTLGFDMEKPIQLMAQTTQRHIVQMRKEMKAYKSRIQKETETYGDPKTRLAGLVDSLKERGYEIEEYMMPYPKIMGTMSVPGADKQYVMAYTSMFPGFVREKGVSLLKGTKYRAALGIVSGNDNETPGRDLTGGRLPHHLTEAEIKANLEDALNQYVDVEGRQIRFRDIYVFALNDARIALMLDKAVKDSTAQK